MNRIICLVLLTIYAYQTTSAELPANTTGLSLAEVTSIDSQDNSAFDGAVSVKAKLKIIKSTGTTTEQIVIMKAYGGLTVFGSPPPPLSDLAQALTKNLKVWLAYGAMNEVIAWAEDSTARNDLEAAIREDKYRKKAAH